jgi:peroxiredoxin Q/BCP
VDKQAKFRDKHRLNMPLLSDMGKTVAANYGVYRPKSLYSKLGMGIERTTFIIGEDGLIKKIFPKVKIAGHVEKVLEALDSIK